MVLTVTKPTVGGSEDSWGTTINTALDDIVLEINSNADGTNAITLQEGGFAVGATTVTVTRASSFATAYRAESFGIAISASSSILTIPRRVDDAKRYP